MYSENEPEVKTYSQVVRRETQPDRDDSIKSDDVKDWNEYQNTRVKVDEKVIRCK